MSIKQVAAAFEFDTENPAAKAVLLALAYRANASGECWPEQANIAKMTSQSVDSVQRRLKELIAAGAVTRVPRYAPRTGGRTSDLYTVHLGQAATGKIARPYTATLRSMSPLPNTATVPFTPTALLRFNNERSVERSEERKSLSLFDRLFAAYPERKGISKALTKLPAQIEFDKRIREGADGEKMIADVKRYADDNKDPTFIMLPENWIRNWSNVETPVMAMVTPGTPEWDQLRAYYVSLGAEVYLREMDHSARYGRPFPKIMDVPGKLAKAA
jgi:Helix-turn-helix domain